MNGPGETATAVTASQRRLQVRLVAFLLLVAALEVGPIVKQAFGVHTNRLRSWQMFHKKAVGICDVDYTVRAPDGTSRAVTTAEVVRTTKREINDHFGSPYRIRSAVEADATGAVYCGKLPAGSAVHAVVRCADVKQGWVAQRDGSDDLCVRKPDKGRVVPKPPAPAPADDEDGE
jgi:hypothetical protein